ncbi:heparanase-like [Sinocyclocheilus anshuiensis]|uniref:heparanase-like n=1 Tax=Sinocyclocheilus anshuiensis TaxID=1608454 RepID=UPI0007B9EA82|nr:PREDICTED: heparanase-like [Sinocyclocheilus anshuiensis]
MKPMPAKLECGHRRIEQMKSAATAVSTIVALALFGALYVGAKTVISVDDVQSIRVDLDLSHVARRVDERFLSVAIDASLIAEERFMNLLNSPTLRTLAKALVPAFLRFGGTKQDFMTFNPRGRYFQARDNSSSAVLEKLCERLELPPLLENRLKQEWVLQSKTLLQEELEGKYKKTKFSACTWHHYYVNGRDTSLHDFLDPEVLDTLATKINEVLEIVESVSPGKKVWLGETSSAYGGGAVGLSDTFVAGFMWLDKLGLAAKLGLDVVIRQVLIGSGTYHLVDDNLDPLPDYWLSLLYKRLVGPEVLKAEVNMNSRPKKPIRVYLHCTNRKSTHYRPGAVTLFALNLNKNEVTIILPDHMANSTIEAFVLQSAEAGEQSLYSRSVKLNGQVLRMVDDRTLPPLKGRELPPGEHIKLPGFSFAFYVLIEAQALVCK